MKTAETLFRDIYPDEVNALRTCPSPCGGQIREFVGTEQPLDRIYLLEDFRLQDVIPAVITISEDGLSATSPAEFIRLLGKATPPPLGAGHPAISYEATCQTKDGQHHLSIAYDEASDNQPIGVYYRRVVTERDYANQWSLD